MYLFFQWLNVVEVYMCVSHGVNEVTRLQKKHTHNAMH